ncbi:GNAT family N-acetyltransferase [Rhodoferax sp.]|uniref:GNAT family N-acetyltransferase n=1 Tax=Rhodoferax sp. TaxID=50421 RepID=UPI00374DF045
MTTTNTHQQAIGLPLPGWSARALPPRQTLQGHYCRLEPLDPQHHADDLYAAYSQAPDDRDWTYLPVGPFSSAASYREHAERAAASSDFLHFAVIDLKTERAVGTLALMRMDPANGVIEVGFVVFSPLLQRTPISTEAQFLLMQLVFDSLGYRRFEWKCDSLNAPSLRAAKRLGFQFEGIFRQATVYKGRNRDTAWFSILDSEWPALRAGFTQWLAPENFDAQGQQRQALAVRPVAG